jgi:tetratricopeptide (TPR) repeat protein
VAHTITILLFFVTQANTYLEYARMGDGYQAQQQFPEAEQAYRKAVLLADRPDQRHARAIVLRNLGSVLTAEARFDEALEALNEAAALASRNQFKDPLLAAEIFNSLGVAYFNRGDLRRAESAFEQATRIDAQSNKALDVALTNLGSIYQRRRQYAKAQESYERSLQVTEGRLGSWHPNLSVTLHKLGSLLTAVGRYKDAKALFERGLAILEKSGLSNEKLAMQTLEGLATTYIDEHDSAGAEPLLKRAAEIARRRAVQPADTAEAIEVLETYSKVLNDVRKPVEAQKVHEEARRIRASMTLTVRAPRP